MGAPVPSQPPDFTASSFPARPPLECSIVMKGGITSGVVYPHAVCELASTYLLREVGGASAGAIAAAAAAAAEVGRARLAAGDITPGVPLDQVGFLNLATMPSALTAPQSDGKPLLFHLFRPQDSLRTLFRVITGTLDGVADVKAGRLSTAALIMRSLVSVVSAYTLTALAAALPGVLLLVSVGVLMAAARGQGLNPLVLVAGLLVVVVGLVLVVAGLLVGAALGLAGDVGRIGDQGFGLTRGMGERPTDLALTPWLFERLQSCAGRSGRDAPLTFGDCADAGVTLRIMTTNLSRSEPLTMPWEGAEYFYDPIEMGRLFPPAVVAAMIAPPLPHAPAERFAVETLRAQAAPLVPWPQARDLPVIVATRMSLSFPVLITAVPLHRVDYASSANRARSKAVATWRTGHPAGTPQECAAAVVRPTFDTNWFSDGGLTANLPVHFFDSALPVRPTFAIDLAPFSSDRTKSADEAENSFMPGRNSSGLHRRSADWTGKRGFGALTAFAASLLETARVWLDEAQLVRPGYRDRVVTVYQDQNEGGLNLAMPKEVVEGLTLRGRLAARKVVTAFAGDQPGAVAPWAWRNHRWLRLRSTSAALARYLHDFADAYDADAPPGATYAELLADAEAPSYAMGVTALGTLRARLAALRTEAAAWAAAEGALSDGAPSPAPELRLASGDPRHGSDA